MLKQLFDNYGTPNYPASGDFIDFTVVLNGPDVYTYGFPADKTCQYEAAVEVVENLKLVQGMKTYECISYNQDSLEFDMHSIPLSRSATQQLMIQDMLVALKTDKSPIRTRKVDSDSSSDDYEIS